MRLCTFFAKARISSKKFYDIVRDSKDRILPKSAEQTIISKYLKDNTGHNQSIKPTKTSVGNNQINYHQYINANPHGCIIQKQHKGVTLNLVSLGYQNVEISDIYKICQKFNPDLVLVQAKPQNYIKDYQLLPKINGSFSDKLYLDQICPKSSKDIKNNILNPSIIQKLQNILQINNKQLATGKVYIKQSRDIVEDEVLIMSAYYAFSNKKQLMLAQLPDQPWKQWFCNSHTLMELQEIFKNICKNIPFYESLNLSPYRLGILTNPSLFLNLRDRYMSTLIEMAISTGKHKRILCILGLMENQAVQHILQNELLLKKKDDIQQFTPIIEYLIGPQVKHSLIRDIEGWQIIEKHIIMDVMQYGEQIANEPLQSFKTTNKVIDHYGKKLNDYPKHLILKFRYDKTMQYLDLMRSQIQQGRQLKKKLMLRQAIRSNAQEL